MGMLASPKYPISKVVVQTIMLETRNAPAVAKIGCKRPASHSKTGNGQATGSSIFQISRGSTTMIALTIASDSRATAPSMYSLGDGGWRRASKKPITNGATMTIPVKSPRNQCSQVGSTAVDGPSNILIATATPSDGANVPKA